MEFSHCFNPYFHGSAAALPWKVQGFGQSRPKTLHLNKAGNLESLGFQGFRLCSVRIKIRYFNGHRRALRVGAFPKNPTRRWRYQNKTIVLFFMDPSMTGVFQKQQPGGKCRRAFLSLQERSSPARHSRTQQSTHVAPYRGCAPRGGWKLPARCRPGCCLRLCSILARVLPGRNPPGSFSPPFPGGSLGTGPPAGGGHDSEGCGFLLGAL